MNSNLLLATVLALLIAIGGARAQDAPHHHPLHQDFYRHWMRPDGLGSCCNARMALPSGGEIGDCEPTYAEVRAGQWWAWVRQTSEWLMVPDSRIIHVRNPTGQDAHLCWTPAAGIMCFNPPDTGG